MEQQRVIECGGVLDISAVAQWRAQAMDALESGRSLVLKADTLQRVDAVGLQAMLGLIMDADNQSIPVQWENPSLALQEAARLTGLTEYLRLA